MKYCPNCGKELFDEALMCPECKISFLKYHKLTFLHRYQTLPLINPAISISVDGYKPVPVVKSDSVVYKLCPGMHHIKLTGKSRTAEFDIDLTDNIIIMAEWNAATGGIDHRETVGEIIDSVPVNFIKEVDDSKVDDSKVEDSKVDYSKKEQQTPSEHDDTAELNESVDDSNAVKSSNAKSGEKDRNEKALMRIFIGFGCFLLIIVILVGALFASEVKNDQNNNHYSQSTTVADSEKTDTEGSTESTTETTTENQSSTYDMVSLDDYKRATQNINLGSDSIDISVDNFHSSYDGTAVLATLYFENIDVGAIIIMTETVGSTEYIKRITVSTSLSEFSDKIQTKQDAVAIGSSISMSAIMPVLNNCQYFDSNDISAKLNRKYTYTTDGKTVEGDSNNYHYSYSQPSYTQIFIGCEFNN